jgi:hypothetical protein
LLLEHQSPGIYLGWRLPVRGGRHGGRPPGGGPALPAPSVPASADARRRCARRPAGRLQRPLAAGVPRHQLARRDQGQDDGPAGSEGAVGAPRSRGGSRAGGRCGGAGGPRAWLASTQQLRCTGTWRAASAKLHVQGAVAPTCIAPWMDACMQPLMRARCGPPSLPQAMATSTAGNCAARPAATTSGCDSAAAVKLLVRTGGLGSGGALMPVAAGTETSLGR